MCSGRSFINIQKSRGPKILPCGTPDCMIPTAETLLFAQTYCDLCDRCDWKKGMRESYANILLIFAAGLCGPLNRRFS